MSVVSRSCSGDSEKSTVSGRHITLGALVCMKKEHPGYTSNTNSSRSNSTMKPPCCGCELFDF
jgi:hypothetical protein